MNWLRLFAYAGLALLVIPVVALLYWGLGPLRDPLGYGTEIQRGIALSLMASSMTVVIDVLLFTPLAYYLARNRNPIAETLVDIPASIPHPVMGIALLVIDSPLTATGQFLTSIGLNFFDTVVGLVVALTAISAPIYIKAIQPFFESMNRAHEDFALGLGASKLRTFVGVVIPNSTRGIVSACLIALSRAMSEFGSIAIIAFSVVYAPFGLSGTSPASVAVYEYFSYYGLGPAVTASAVLVLVSIPLMIAFRAVRGGVKVGR